MHTLSVKGDYASILTLYTICLYYPSHCSNRRRRTRRERVVHARTWLMRLGPASRSPRSRFYLEVEVENRDADCYNDSFVFTWSPLTLSSELSTDDLELLSDNIRWFGTDNIFFNNYYVFLHWSPSSSPSRETDSQFENHRMNFK